MVDYFLNLGAAADEPDSCGMTPIMLAAGNGMLHVVRRLLSLRVDIHRRDFLGRTPLFWAAAGGFPRVAQELITAGSDPLVRATMGLSARDISRHSPRLSRVLSMGGAKRMGTPTAAPEMSASLRSFVRAAAGELAAENSSASLDTLHEMVYPMQRSLLVWALLTLGQHREANLILAEWHMGPRPYQTCRVCDDLLGNVWYLCAECVGVQLCTSCYDSLCAGTVKSQDNASRWKDLELARIRSLLVHQALWPNSRLDGPGLGRLLQWISFSRKWVDSMTHCFQGLSDFWVDMNMSSAFEETQLVSLMKNIHDERDTNSGDYDLTFRRLSHFTRDLHATYTPGGPLPEAREFPCHGKAHHYIKASSKGEFPECDQQLFMSDNRLRPDFYTRLEAMMSDYGAPGAEPTNEDEHVGPEMRSETDEVLAEGHDRETDSPNFESKARIPVSPGPDDSPLDEVEQTWVFLRALETWETPLPPPNLLNSSLSTTSIETARILEMRSAHWAVIMAMAAGSENKEKTIADWMAEKGYHVVETEGAKDESSRDITRQVKALMGMGEVSEVDPITTV